MTLVLTPDNVVAVLIAVLLILNVVYWRGYRQGARDVSRRDL